MERARGAGAMVFYTLVGPDPSVTPAAMVDPGLAARDGEWVYQRGPDKFLGSDLEKRLKDRGINTVIVTGTSAQGVVIGTGSGAARL
jgi:nicotinamidase-related amidase